LEGASFTVRPLRLHPALAESREERWMDPVPAARLWGAAAGATHFSSTNRARLAARITPALQAELVARSNAYLASMRSDQKLFASDPRVAEDEEREASEVAAWVGEAAKTTQVFERSQ